MSPNARPPKIKFTRADAHKYWTAFAECFTGVCHVHAYVVELAGLPSGPLVSAAESCQPRFVNFVPRTAHYSLYRLASEEFPHPWYQTTSLRVSPLSGISTAQQVRMPFPNLLFLRWRLPCRLGAALGEEAPKFVKEKLELLSATNILGFFSGAPFFDIRFCYKLSRKPRPSILFHLYNVSK